MIHSLPVLTPNSNPHEGPVRALSDHPCGLTVQAQQVLALLAQPDCYGRTALAAGKVSVIGKRGGISLVVGQVELTQIDSLVTSGHLIRVGHGEGLIYRVARRQQAHATQSAQEAVAQRPRIQTRQEKRVRVAQESPLLWLARRKDKSGHAMISATALAAGERLQQDFIQAGMSPNMSSDWSGMPVRGAGHAGSALLHSERHMAALQRLRKALDACGSELAGVLLDLCCFLKPIEVVEQERGWPARSGKVILKLALSALMRHYGLSEYAQGSSRPAKHSIWRASDQQAD